MSCIANMSYISAEWSQKMINDLPDSCFALTEQGGHKDSENKTVPRSLRHLPYKNADGSIDRAHLVNGMARITHTKLSPALQKRAYDVLLNAYKTVGMEHPQCSVPGCKGYSPAKRKSMLDAETFRAYQEEWFRSQGKRAFVVA
jgi:hypothetical protein